MASAIAGASKGLADIDSMVETAGQNSQASINELKKLVDDCYFGAGGCTAVKPKVDTPPAVTSQTVTPQTVTPNPNAATPEQAKQAAAYKAILEDCHTYGVGTENGAANCTVKQSGVIKQATEGAVMGRVGTGSLTKRDVATLRANVQHACAALAQCNKAGYKEAGCFR
jgi:hypothetical protein